MACAKLNQTKTPEKSAYLIQFNRNLVNVLYVRIE